MPRLDHELERVQAALAAERRALGTEHVPDPEPEERAVITTPRNGRKWWADTWGKAVGTVIAAAILAAAAWGGPATLAVVRLVDTVFGLPPRVETLEVQVRALQAVPPATLSPQVNATLDRINGLLERAERREQRRQ